MTIERTDELRALVGARSLSASVDEAIEACGRRTRGVRAGQLLGQAGAGSELAVDAFTVAVADLSGGAVIATADIKDLERLASHASSVVMADIRG